ncbi:MAG TPA: hypothetical protein ENJ82_05330 [Bacteroidetes bacterium]|nr:hypothetical protein [Bacteroidota bacterium]
MSKTLIEISQALKSSEVQSVTEFTSAKMIAKSLCETASWQDDLCSWDFAEETLTGDLYAGNSGTALFLAEMFVETGDSCFAETALGAILRTISDLEISSENLPQTFSEAISVAFYAVKIGLLLENEALLQSGTEIAENLEIPLEYETEINTQFGNAGAILIYLALKGGPGMPKWHNIVLTK